MIEPFYADCAGCRSRLESLNNGVRSPDRRHSPQPPACGDAPPDREVVSPQLVEMHTFRDAIDVNYQRMALTGEELSGVSFHFCVSAPLDQPLSVQLMLLKPETDPVHVFRSRWRT